MSAIASIRPRRPLLRLLWLVPAAGVLGAGVYGYLRASGPPENRLESLSLRQLLDRRQKEQDSEVYWSTLGRRLVDSGSTREAGLAFRQALTVQPDSLRAAAGYACCIGLLGDWDRAARLFSELEARNPPSSDICFYRGLLLFNFGDIEEAQALFARAVQLRSEDACGWYRLARCYVEQNQDGNALPAAMRAYRLNSHRVEYQVLAADLRILSGDARWGRERLEEAVARWPREALPRSALARAILREENSFQEGLRRARELLLEAVALAPKWTEPRVKLARLYLKQGQIEAARRELEQVPPAERRIGECGYVLIQTYRRLGRREEAQRFAADYRRYMQRRLAGNRVAHLSHEAPGDVRLHLRYARCLVEVGSRLPALRQYYEVLRLDPANPEAQRELQKLLRQHGQPAP